MSMVRANSVYPKWLFARHDINMKTQKHLQPPMTKYVSACAIQMVEISGAALLNGGVPELKKLLEKLDKGGVLFLDEAYQLNPATNPMGAQVR